MLIGVCWIYAFAIYTIYLLQWYNHSTNQPNTTTTMGIADVEKSRVLCIYVYTCIFWLLALGYGGNCVYRLHLYIYMLSGVFDRMTTMKNRETCFIVVFVVVYKAHLGAVFKYPKAIRETTFISRRAYSKGITIEPLKQRGVSYTTTTTTPILIHIRHFRTSCHDAYDC